MFDEQAAPPPQAMIITQSPAFRLLYSNFFRLRVAPGECMMTFATVLDVPVQPLGATSITTTSQTPQLTTLVQEEVAVVLPWPVLKTFVQHLNDMVRAIEKEAGTIRPVKSPYSDEQLVEIYSKALRTMLSEL
jgi:hypothetical protein